MTKTEIQAIIDNPLSTPEQRADAQTLLDKMTGSTEPPSEFRLYCDLAGFDLDAESLARHARGFPDAKMRHECFEASRASWKNNPKGMKSFTLEREMLPQERRNYGGD